MATTRSEMEDFTGFDSAMQPLSYPATLSASSSPSPEITRLRTALGNQLRENECLRIELAQQKRKLFQKQQQIYRLMDHVRRLARVLGKYVSGTGGQPQMD